MTNSQFHPHLIVAVALFVLLDLGTLIFNQLISRQLESDAAAINLAGRQRMLSQRITKAAVLATDLRRAAVQRAESANEAGDAYRLFLTTLSAFAEGGEAIGGDGRPLKLAPVRGEAALLVGHVQGMLRQWPEVPASDAAMNAFAQYMVANNLLMMDTMNRLTSELEHQSISDVSTLRVAQIVTFVLALANFFYILITLNRARRSAEADSLTDTLTGLLNRAGVYQVLGKVMAEFERTRSPLGAILLDLDGFKAVNDTLGHIKGDEVLREAAHRLSTWMRPGWVCGRLGGDEFIVICPGVTQEQLDGAAANLTQVMAGMPAGELVVSASVGQAAARTGDDADSLIARADASMYTAKSEKDARQFYRASRR